MRDGLIEAFRILREQHIALYSLVAEVAAIRESLIEIGGPRYDAVISRHQAKHRNETTPSAPEYLREFDEIIEKLTRLP